MIAISDEMGEKAKSESQKEILENVSKCDHMTNNTHYTLQLHNLTLAHIWTQGEQDWVK